MASLLKNALFNPQLSKHVTINSIAPASFGQVRDGSTLKEVKGRIKSVSSIRKITKTMNMIATARLRAAQNRMEKARSYYSTVSKNFENPPKAESPKKNLIITISSDRGLCGAINSSVVKTARNLIRENEDKGVQTEVVCIGEKAPGQLSRDYGDKISWSAGETSKKALNFLASGVLADKILQHEFDVATTVYNRFNTIISYTTTAKQLPSYAQMVASKEAYDEFEFEDDNSLFHLQDLNEYHLAAFLFSSWNDAAAAELGGRMSSMDNATRNAGDMIKRLTIEYNRRRQAAITTELNEIISGASAIQ